MAAGDEVKIGTLTVVDLHAINRFLQRELVRRDMELVPAAEAALWLQNAGLLEDSADGPGLPLRRLLRAGKILGQRQEANGRWFIDRLSTNTKNGEQTRLQYAGSTPFATSVAAGRQRKGSSARDEEYVLDLCNELLRRTSLRQFRFDFLPGDAGHKLPVDAYYPDLRLVIEYREPQHSRPTPFFDKPDRLTVSGVHRGEQRLLYDERRRRVLPEHGIALVEISYDELTHTAKGRLSRDRREDARVLQGKLAAWLKNNDLDL